MAAGTKISLVQAGQSDELGRLRRVARELARPLTAKELRPPLLTLYREHEQSGNLPTSARFLFYEVESRGFISKVVQERSDGKKGRRPDQNMLDALTWLRENGDIRWEDIVDETRDVDDFSGFPTLLDGVFSYLDEIALDPWKGDVPFILTESRSLAGVLRPIASEYGVRIASTNGQCNGFLRTEVAPKINSTVLYFGDYDFSGGHIQDNSRRILESFTRIENWENLAVTADQVEEHKLTPIQKLDKRDGKKHEAVETEALGQAVIVGILRDRLNTLLPEPLDSVLERERKERATIRRKLRR